MYDENVSKDGVCYVPWFIRNGCGDLLCPVQTLVKPPVEDGAAVQALNFIFAYLEKTHAAVNPELWAQICAWSEQRSDDTTKVYSELIGKLDAEKKIVAELAPKKPQAQPKQTRTAPARQRTTAGKGVAPSLDQLLGREEVVVDDEDDILMPPPPPAGDRAPMSVDAAHKVKSSTFGDDDDDNEGGPVAPPPLPSSIFATPKLRKK